jgi:hypothetical protein
LQKEPRYRHLRTYFRQMGGISKVLFYDMRMTREEWQAISQNGDGP